MSISSAVCSENNVGRRFVRVLAQNHLHGRTNYRDRDRLVQILLIYSRISPKWFVPVSRSSSRRMQIHIRGSKILQYFAEFGLYHELFRLYDVEIIYCYLILGRKAG